MKLASVVSAVISSLAPMAFAQDAIKNPGADLPATEYHYGMSLDVDKVLHRASIEVDAWLIAQPRPENLTSSTVSPSSANWT